MELDTLLADNAPPRMFDQDVSAEVQNLVEAAQRASRIGRRGHRRRRTVIAGIAAGIGIALVGGTAAAAIGGWPTWLWAPDDVIHRSGVFVADGTEYECDIAVKVVTGDDVSPAEQAAIDYLTTAEPDDPLPDGEPLLAEPGDFPDPREGEALLQADAWASRLFAGMTAELEAQGLGGEPLQTGWESRCSVVTP
jgi:hypothetical protein